MKFLYVAHIPFVLLFLAFTIGLLFWSLQPNRDRPQPSRDREGAVKGRQK